MLLGYFQTPKAFQALGLMLSWKFFHREVWKMAKLFYYRNHILFQRKHIKAREQLKAIKNDQTLRLRCSSLQKLQSGGPSQDAPFSKNVKP